jgi:hypothetical protein
LEREIGRFMEYPWPAAWAGYDHQQYRESLDNLTPADLYFGKAKIV